MSDDKKLIKVVNCPVCGNMLGVRDLKAPPVTRVRIHLGDGRMVDYALDDLEIVPCTILCPFCHNEVKIEG